METEIDKAEFPLLDTRLLRADLILCYLENARVALLKQSKALYDTADFSEASSGKHKQMRLIT